MKIAGLNNARLHSNSIHESTCRMTTAHEAQHQQLMPARRKTRLHALVHASKLGGAAALHKDVVCGVCLMHCVAGN
jgi:hypothetical protein